MDSGKKTISAVSSCFNEEGNLDRFYDRLKAVLDRLTDYAHEIIVADGMEKAMGEMRRTPDALFDQVATMVAGGYMDKMEADG